MDDPIILPSGTSAEEHADNLAARLEALGCSAEHIAEARADVLARAIHRGDDGDPQKRGS